MSALPAVLVHPAPLRLVGLSAAAQEAIDATPEEIIRRWLLGLSDSARRSYRRAIHRFAAWAMPSADPSPEAAMRLLVTAGPGPAREMVCRWRDELLQEGLAPGSVCCLTTGIASLVKACRRAGLIGWALEAVAPRYERRQDRSGPRRHQVEALFATIDERAAAGDRQAVRDAALLRLLYVAALRRSEAVGLRVEDLDLQHPDGPQVRPRRKGRRERSVVLVSQRTAEAIARWLAVRGTQPGPVFHRLDRRQAEPKPLRGESVRRLLRSWAPRAGVRSTIRPHGLRHSAATEVARRGSLAQLMALGQWSTLSAASSYLDRHAEERRTALGLVDL